MSVKSDWYLLPISAIRRLKASEQMVICDHAQYFGCGERDPELSNVELRIAFLERARSRRRAKQYEKAQGSTTAPTHRLCAIPASEVDAWLQTLPAPTPAPGME